jgi:hypothetical protein
MFHRAKHELDGLTNPGSALLIHHRAAFWLTSVAESPVTLPPHRAWKERICPGFSTNLQHCSNASQRKRSDWKFSWVKLDPAWCETSFWEDFVNSIPPRRSMSGFHRLDYARRYEASVKTALLLTMVAVSLSAEGPSSPFRTSLHHYTSRSSGSCQGKNRRGKRFKGSLLGS